MPIPYRRELEPCLREFVDARPGLRLGRMFGLPAVYAGRRLAIFLFEDGVVCRLPPDVARAEVAGAGRPFDPGGTPAVRRPRARRRPRASGWVCYRPKTPYACRRLAPVFEAAARYVAERRLAEGATR